MTMTMVMVMGTRATMTMVATWCTATHHVWMELQGGALRVRLIIVIYNNLILYYIRGHKINFNPGHDYLFYDRIIIGRSQGRFSGRDIIVQCYFGQATNTAKSVW